MELLLLPPAVAVTDALPVPPDVVAVVFEPVEELNPITVALSDTHVTVAWHVTSLLPASNTCALSGALPPIANVVGPAAEIVRWSTTSAGFDGHACVLRGFGDPIVKSAFGAPVYVRP